MDGIEAKLNKLLADPEALGSMLEMAKSFTGGGGGSPAAEAQETSAAEPSGGGGLMDLVGSMNPETLGTIMNLVSEYSREDDRRTKLLTALKPYVSAERQAKMDRATQYVRMARTAKMAMGSFGGREDV